MSSKISSILPAHLKSSKDNNKTISPPDPSPQAFHPTAPSAPAAVTSDNQDRLRQQGLIPSNASSTSGSTVSAPTILSSRRSSQSSLPFYEGGVRSRHTKFVTWLGRFGFIAKGIVYGIIGVLTCTNATGAWTPNGSQNNESPQGAFLLLGGIPAVGRPILVIMAIGLITYIIWRFWEAITGQGQDINMGKKGNFFRYRLSPFVSGCVYAAYTYYVIQMIYQTAEEQQTTASSKEFPASWTSSMIGRAGIGVLGIAFIIATITQLVNAITGNFITDLKTSDPNARRWEAIIVHTAGRIGFVARGAVFCTMSGFFWDSLAKRNESGRQNMTAAALSKLAENRAGRAFMIILGTGLVIYALFAISNVHYKYFPTPPPSRVGVYLEEDQRRENHQRHLNEEEERERAVREAQEKRERQEEKRRKRRKYMFWLPKEKPTTELDPEPAVKNTPWWKFWDRPQPTDLEKS
ncbi:hypothetical protein PHYBLDRAFT_141535 [Phycomyces blakesleeanus NRRL 1555(-)]|uniref:DUF1206 domain-containing protein n=2 Tax=Phycomyces blakesleeanus TaxID=4837 RepID=A0A162Y0U0_PHYB8|nr:hypothetical protein PHYBLDRAFT_141535 [Phycomyces blakesleeanus NRRL 1555(-)]OAD77665.1 hypothetical protein PHYBLDRAFT_141535 [Phycomyces blakesleeanus NRRL 1555(-)]|eukprot:XP_018295705.1 hypothetical protein PHYBLDRAFT_141535 [Phycomyces blakesleeanus NRRL 1555(-)]